MTLVSSSDLPLQGDIIGQVIIGVHTEISSQVLSQINLIENEIFYYGK